MIMKRDCPSMWDNSVGDFSQVCREKVHTRSQIHNKACAKMCENGKNGVHFWLEQVSYLIRPDSDLAYGELWCRILPQTGAEIRDGVWVGRFPTSLVG
jgi:hypothetical protein